MRVIITGSSRVSNFENINNAIITSGWNITEIVIDGYFGVNTVIQTVANYNDYPIKTIYNISSLLSVTRVSSKNNTQLDIYKDMIDYADGIIILDDPANTKATLLKNLAEKRQPGFLIYKYVVVNMLNRINSHLGFQYFGDFPKLIEYIDYTDEWDENEWNDELISDYSSDDDIEQSLIRYPHY